MGMTIDREHFDEIDYERFARRLDECLVALRHVLARPQFGQGPITVGGEVEYALADMQGRPFPHNDAVLKGAADSRLQLELDRFNLEGNLTPIPLKGRPFQAFREELQELTEIVRREARRCGGAPLMVGILPSLELVDLRSGMLTDSPRYQALNNGLKRLRAEPFRIRIDGDEPLEVASDDVAIEGANTAWQVHLRVPPDAFARTYNAAQMAAGPALAVSGNSPVLVGHRLWHETRIALFKQAVDERVERTRHCRVSRVAFGVDWLRGGPEELFEQAVRLHEPILPVVSDERAVEVAQAGLVPRLDELRLHQSTVWRWTRPVYDPTSGGHLRVELRALPSGPTIADMLANTAFLLGVTLDLTARADQLIHVFPFEDAHRNFYRAAQAGLDAELIWPTAEERLESVPARDLVLRLLPVAERGLAAEGVDRADLDECLGIVEERARSGQTGAVWQRRVLAALEAEQSRPEALRALTLRYRDLCADDAPVHTWPVTESTRPGTGSHPPEGHVTPDAYLGIRSLSRDECLERLATHPARIGRVATGGPSPDIFPVNYVLDGTAIVFRTSPGRKLSAVTRGERIAFEVDYIDAQWGSGWSVVVRGVAHHVQDEAELQRLRSLPLRAWSPENKPDFVRINSQVISGREIASNLQP